MMMKRKDELQQELGSVQRQTQKNEQYQSKTTTGIVPFSGKKSSYKTDKPDLNQIDDEKIIPGLARKQNMRWNSVDFESDDFFSAAAY